MSKSFVISGSFHLLAFLIISIIMYVHYNTFAELTSMLMPSRPILYHQVDSEDEDAEPVHKQIVKQTNVIKPQSPAGTEGYEFKEADYSPFYNMDEPPIPLTPISPVYPKDAQKLQIEGVVLLKVYIDEEGIVRRIDVMKSPDASLTRSAVDAIRKTPFKPARKRGKNGGVSIYIPSRFYLQ